LAPDTDYNGAITVARNIECAIKALHIPHKASTVCDYVTVSQGIFIVNANNVIKNVYKYVEKADEALYQSKSYGRNRFTAYEAY
jgi:diguanylate cyclase (GGDEF)-like protein